MKITTEELLEALATASNAPDDARTVAEICAETGISADRVRAALRTCAAEHRLTVHKVVRRALDGRAGQVAAYTVTPKKKATKK